MLKVINNYSISDIRQSITYLLDKSSQEEKVRLLVVEIIQDGQNPIAAIYDWVKKNVTYISDPIVDGDQSELFISPAKMVNDYYEGKHLAGDCDDHALLNVALLRSIGIKSNVVLLDQKGDGYNHAVAQAYSEEAEKYIIIDTTVSFPLGWEEHYVRRLVI